MHLTSMDNMFLAFEQPEHRLAVAAVFTIKSITQESVKESLYHYATSQDKFTMSLNQTKDMFNRPSWNKQHEFNIDDHFHITDCKGDIKQAVGDLISSEFDKSIPLWDCHYFVGLGDENSAILIRAHHCLSDGAGFVRGFLSFVSNSGDNNLIHASFTKKSHIRRTFFDLIYIYLLVLLNFLIGSITWIINFIQVITFHRKSLKRSRKVLQKQVYWSSKFPLSAVKTIKNKLNLTVNDVLVSALSESIESYLSSKNELKDECLWFMIPVAIRNIDDWTLSNQTVGFCFPSPCAGSDILKRLKSTNKEMNKLKKSASAVWGKFFLSFSFIFPNLWHFEFLRNNSINNWFHAVVTNGIFN